MKLYITEELNFKTRMMIEDENKFQDIIDFLEQFSIECEEKDGFVFIEEQKVTLDEHNMNELFDEIFHIFKIEYACMGGAGCEFNINVSLI